MYGDHRDCAVCYSKSVEMNPTSRAADQQPPSLPPLVQESGTPRKKRGFHKKGCKHGASAVCES